MTVITVAGLRPLNSLWGASYKVLCYDPGSNHSPCIKSTLQGNTYYAGAAQTNPVIFMLYVLLIHIIRHFFSITQDNIINSSVSFRPIYGQTGFLKLYNVTIKQ